MPSLEIEFHRYSPETFSKIISLKLKYSIKVDDRYLLNIGLEVF